MKQYPLSCNDWVHLAGEELFLPVNFHVLVRKEDMVSRNQWNRESE
ncbi:MULTISPECIES: hypothetical protein [Desulfosporosinus]|uniref:Uncharacterized protein n=1 Tax=Desulfosporosinus acididurans TaxID=476652 RepID=A0A0J1FWZ2_9FIRM|nr:MULTISPECIES: hypothetical protein [Desulfosporosinus]KLU67920.1 hypothetical protein DEAC_c03280 [Desulfosporosinus acididurans]